MKNSFIVLPLLLLSILLLSGYRHKHISTEKTGIIKISFVNTVKGTPLQLHNTTYTNPFGEDYTISKFKYYISHIVLAAANGKPIEQDNYYLVDEGSSETRSFSFALRTGSYSSLAFLPGVDSLHNVSGAQTDALDPLNDMFWTWNTGYIMAKIEGKSPQSKVVNNKLEYHIGGFMGPYSVLQPVTLHFPAGKQVVVEEGRTCEIIIEADINTWWQQPNDIRISEHPVCSSPGALAKKIADNYSKMFTIKDVVYQTPEQ